jgi:hypothetical protein
MHSMPLAALRPDALGDAAFFMRLSRTATREVPSSRNSNAWVAASSLVSEA